MEFQGVWTAILGCYLIGVELLSGRFEELKSSLAYIGGRDLDDVAMAMPMLRAVAEAVTPRDNVMAFFRERILAFTNGSKAKPFDETFQMPAATDYASRMDENQRRALFIANVVFDSLERYKLAKELERMRGWGSGPRHEELERVIRNAIYTALEAESGYEQSHSSKLFVDRYLALFPKRWVPAARIELLAGDVVVP